MKREVWADNVKAIACILVVMGHFLQSMNRSNVIGDSQIYGLLVKTIYYFHVPCFFLISGYFHQTNPKYSTIAEYSKYIFEKLINLGIPYLVFSSITYVLKIIFEDAVNVSNNKSLLYNLLLEPISPYWFLYILFLCYLFIPIMKQTNKQNVFADSDHAVAQGAFIQQYHFVTNPSKLIYVIRNLFRIGNDII